jgi:hypothetical protein
LFGALIGSAGNTTSQVAATYQSLLIVLTSLALIWAIRKTVANDTASVKEAFYRGTAQFVPLILVICVIGLQLIPLLIGGVAYGAIQNGGLAVTSLEKIIVVAVLVLLILGSLYLLSSSLFAIYIVTLPGMTPMKALRGARELTRKKRWLLVRKIVFLPFALLMISAVIIIPTILIVSVVAGWLFFAMSIIALAVMHAYMYLLYKELL